MKRKNILRIGIALIIVGLLMAGSLFVVSGQKSEGFVDLEINFNIPTKGHPWQDDNQNHISVQFIDKDNGGLGVDHAPIFVDHPWDD